MSHKLLLADDSVTIQRVIELTFSGEKFEVLAVGDGEQAIARIPAERPDIVLADIGMPKRSGYDVAAFVKGRPDLRHIPVLLLAGAFEPVDETRAEQVGCDGVLVKPFEPQHVVARVRELIEGATGSPTLATAAVPRPVERLTAPRHPESPQQGETPATPAVSRDTVDRDAVDAGESGPASEPEPLEPRTSPQQTTGESLNAYFDRLNAAFASLEAAAPPPVASPGRTPGDEPVGVPTLEAILGPTVAGLPPAAPLSQEPVGATYTSPLPPPEPSAAARNMVADAFSALLAVEQGEPGTTPVVLPGGQAQPVISEALVEELTRRVIERLTPDAVRHLVSGVVSEVAERLVREEIERFRGQQ